MALPAYVLLKTLPWGFEQHVGPVGVLTRRAAGADADYGPRTACTDFSCQRAGESLERNGVRTASTCRICRFRPLDHLELIARTCRAEHSKNDGRLPQELLATGQFVFEVVKAHVATSPRFPTTIHYSGDGRFMIAGETTSMYRKGFKPENS